jgi:hypothetical protein
VLHDPPGAVNHPERLFMRREVLVAADRRTHQQLVELVGLHQMFDEYNKGLSKRLVRERLRRISCTDLRRHLDRLDTMLDKRKAANQEAARLKPQFVGVTS